VRRAQVILRECERDIGAGLDLRLLEPGIRLGAEEYLV
jgi:hypothetical protein